MSVVRVVFAVCPVAFDFNTSVGEYYRKQIPPSSHDSAMFCNRKSDEITNLATILVGRIMYERHADTRNLHAALKIRQMGTFLKRYERK